MLLCKNDKVILTSLQREVKPTNCKVLRAVRQSNRNE